MTLVSLDVGHYPQLIYRDALFLQQAVEGWRDGQGRGRRRARRRGQEEQREGGGGGINSIPNSTGVYQERILNTL